MIALIKYIFDTAIKKMNNKCSAYQKNLKYITEASGQLVELAHAFATDKDNTASKTNNKMVMGKALLNVPAIKKITERYKNYSEDQIERSFELMKEEGLKVPKPLKLPISLELRLTK